MTLDDLQLEQTNTGEERVFRKRIRGLVHATKLRHFDVFAQVNGARMKIGRVYRGLQTFERRTKGRTYVNSRWESPRWFFDVEGAPWRRSQACESRKRALEGLIYHWEHARS